MEKRLAELLESKGDNYILPFFWQHGEEEAVLREYMEKIQDCGIQAVCVECRPHPDFCGPKWWHDFDIIMDEARTRGMKVWLLDDAHFPTGTANGALAEADPSLCKQYINFETADIAGPKPQVVLDVASMARFTPSPFGGGANRMFRGPEPRLFDDDSLMTVLATRLVEEGALDTEFVDLSHLVEDGKMVWNVPDGMWRVYVVYKTRNGGGRTDYINMLDPASCQVQLDAVYEPHYARYKDDFGKTFVGFFSDEPLFGNTVGFNFDEIVGKKEMPLPWSNYVPGMLEERLGKDWMKKLPVLWADSADKDVNAQVRYAYMDTVTKMAEENFSNLLGGWCSDHGVEYIGHTIEDNNQHARLGSSLGHYFRGLAGQHMAGIDNIGNQVLLAGENHTRKGGFTEGDGEFYHFILGKLASSHAHIDPKKLGRAMCEIYGAYGWSCGVRLMKYLTDHFLVRGVNYFVPHAFSPKEFPDFDCPPHFYAHGHNPQYRHFQKLMMYLNRVCHLTNGGTHIAPVAMLYHGEAEWTGGHMFMQKPARQLMENQIDFDILPSDVFVDMEMFNASFDGSLNVNGETYKALVVPYAEFITKKVAKFGAMASKQGFEVIFIDALPAGISDNTDTSGNSALIAGLATCSVVKLNELAQYLEAKGFNDVKLSTKFDRLRYYRYRQSNDIYLFSNEESSLVFDGEITVKSTGDAVLYDAYENVLRPLEYTAVSGGTKLSLRVEPYQMAIVIMGDAIKDYPLVPALSTDGDRTAVDGTWKLSYAESREYPNFTNEETVTKLESIGLKHSEFSGFIRYETIFDLKTGSTATLELEDAYEGVEVWVNGKNAGIKIAPPYLFDISKLVKDGTNSLKIEVANTLDQKVRSMTDGGGNIFGRGSAMIEPSGIVGEVSIYSK